MSASRTDREFAVAALLVAAAEIYSFDCDKSVVAQEIRKLLEEVPVGEKELREIGDIVSEVLGCDPAGGSGARHESGCKEGI